MKILVVLVAAAVLFGCSKSDSVGPGEIKKFELGSRLYDGRSVANCDQETADKICREFGYERANEYDCRTEKVNGVFWVFTSEQDVMYCFTCWRR
jgi:hypothetical protein